MQIAYVAQEEQNLFSRARNEHSTSESCKALYNIKKSF